MPRIDRIELRAVTRFFGAVPALRGVSGTFSAGSLVFLEGPNGAGKSTLLAIVGTVLKPSSGRVLYPPLGDDVEHVREEVGWVAHESHCYRDLTGRQNVEFAARLRGVDAEAAWQEGCRRLGLEGFGERALALLSRGQRQRVALARALVHRPSVLLLDEPFSGLDPASADRLKAVLEEERRAGTLVVVVNHQPGLAEELGARAVRLQNGRMTE